MNKLSQKEWIAVVISVSVIGFFFLFGQTLVAALMGNKAETSKQMSQTTELQVTDSALGTGDVAQAGDIVVVNYTGKFTDGTVFDSSFSRNEPFQFILGAGQVIKGWDQGIIGMKVGGKRTLVVPSDLGYGPSDYGPIPGGSTLVFDVELLKVEKQ